MMMTKTVFSVLLLKQNAKKRRKEKNQLVNAHHSATLKHIEDF